MLNMKEFIAAKILSAKLEIQGIKDNTFPRQVTKW